MIARKLFNEKQKDAISYHAVHGGFVVKARIQRPDNLFSVYDPKTRRFWVHKTDYRKSAKQELVFETEGGVASTLTAAHPLKILERGGFATPRETARLQGFPDSFQLPQSCYNDLFGNAVCVPVAKHCIQHVRSVRTVKTFVDVCSGIGGFHVAASQLGMECVGFSEVKKTAIQCYEKNFPATPSLGPLESADWPQADMVVAGFPCQPFSRSMQTEDRENHHSRNISECLPGILDATGANSFVFENVQSIRALGRDVLADLISSVEEKGFRVEKQILDAADFGVPQKRKRMFIVGIKNAGTRLSPIPVFPTVAAKKAVLRDILEDE